MTRPHMDRQFAETAHEKQARLRKARAKKGAAREPVTITVLVPRRGSAMAETRTVHDPFMGVDVQISDRLVDRLRGKYACGPHLPNGNPEFGWKQFQAPPIQHEAADRIERLEHEQRETLRAVLHHFGPEGAKLVTDHVLANQK